jgi:hypothetical protein
MRKVKKTAGTTNHTMNRAPTYDIASKQEDLDGTYIWAIIWSDISKLEHRASFAGLKEVPCISKQKQEGILRKTEFQRRTELVEAIIRRDRTWARPPGVSCFVSLRIVSYRYERHVGPCQYDMVNIFFGPNTVRGTPARLLVVLAQARSLKYLC